MSDWPASLPGLDLTKALGQLGGKKTLYLRLLGMFNDAHTEDANKIIAAANAEDWTQVQEVNHALKGVAGNLAANDLYQLCVDIDAKMKGGSQDIQAELDALPGAMEQLLASIAEASKLDPE